MGVMRRLRIETTQHSEPLILDGRQPNAEREIDELKDLHAAIFACYIDQISFHHDITQVSGK